MVDLEKLRLLREAQRLSQAEVSRRLGFESTTAYNYKETGHRGITADELAKLAAMLGVLADDLLVKEQVGPA